MPRKRKDQKGGNNLRQESDKKLRVKKEQRERKKESGKTKRENTAGIGACINRPYFLSLLANPLFDVPKSNS